MIHSCGTIFLYMEPSEAVAVNPGYYEQHLDGALAGRQARACLTRSSFVPRTLPAAMSSTHTTDQVASSDVRTFTVMRLGKSASPGTNYRRWLPLRLFRPTISLHHKYRARRDFSDGQLPGPQATGAPGP